MTSAASYDNLVQELYVAYLGRPADPTGEQNFSTALANIAAPTDAAGLLALYDSNAAVQSLVNAFGASAESQALYGSGSDASFVNAIFENLFNRSANVAGLNFWTNAISSGEMTRGEAALAIAAGAQATSTQGTADVQTLGAKLTASQDFTADLVANPKLAAAYAGAAAAEEGRAFLSTLNGGTTVILSQEAQQAANGLLSGGASLAGTSGAAVSITSGVTFTSAGDITFTATGGLISSIVGQGTSATIGGGQLEALTLGTHSYPDNIVLSPTGASSTDTVHITGLNNDGSDSITFKAEQSGSVNGVSQQGNTLVGFQQVTNANVTSSGGNATSLQGWIAAADGAAGSGVSGAAHTVTWFVFQGNTYVLESVAGQTADAGTMAANNTLVELTGTGYTFNHTTGANGTLHLLG